jgi:hypothetical protein
MMTLSMIARAAMRSALLIIVLLMTFAAKAAVFDENDTSRMTNINEAIASLETDVSRSLHDVPPNDAEQIEAYSYVKLNLEAAQERLNSIFLLVAVSMYVDSASDLVQILHLIYAQLLPPGKTYLNEKKDAIASMAASHPANDEFAAYNTRAAAILGERAIPLLDELDRRIAAVLR